MSPHVVLGVTGGIAAYKAADIVRGLQRGGAEVTVVMTDNARQFITPLTLQALSGRRVITGTFDPSPEPDDSQDIEHIDLARRCDVLLIAPATAGIIGKMAAGLADDFLSTFCLAVRCPTVVAPAMNTAMWEHPAVAENIGRLKARGVVIIEPEHGALASRGEGEGVGRLAAPEAIVKAVMGLLGARIGEDAGARASGHQSAMHEGNGVPLTGRKVLVTAGPTREPLDPVRFLSSPSSGKMGFAIAEAARKLGAEVILVTGPTHLPDPGGVTTLRVTTAEQMRREVLGHLDGVRIVVKTAAVSDFRPASSARQKIGKDQAPAQIALERTPDILAEVAAAGGGRYVVGFAAETGDPVPRAREKLKAKNLDLIVANDVSREGAGFGADTNEVTLIDRSGAVEAWPRMTKALLADRLMRFVAGKLG